MIARVHGLALGGGVELALACHAIVATPKATLAFPETGIGIYPGLGGTQRTTRRVGTGLAKWLVLTGQMLTADEALAIGLVDAVVAPEQLDATIAVDRREWRRTPRQRRPCPPDYQALADFFDRHTPDAIRSGTAADAGDQQLAKAVKKVGTKAPIALRIAADLIDRGAGSPARGGPVARARALGRDLPLAGCARRAVEPWQESRRCLRTKVRHLNLQSSICNLQSSIRTPAINRITAFL